MVTNTSQEDEAFEATGPRICHLGGTGMIFPSGGDSENMWPTALRVCLYALGLVYFFLGVAIVADTFVAAIETVTLRKAQTRNKQGKLVTQKVWNDTVATLSLMALGSSAPEIALSVVDLFKKEFHFAPLGAVTIAGSAAFNLFVIVAVCILVIPSNETRQVKELPAFYVTAIVSVFAYFWLVLILTIRTPNVVEIWEAVATFLFLPLLIWVSYRVDIMDATVIVNRLSGRWSSSEAEEPTMDSCILGFDEDELSVDASPDVAKVIDIVVRRQVCCSSAISVGYRTERLRAVPSYDFTEAEGRLVFGEDVTEQTIRLEILPRAANRWSRKFLLILEELEGKVEFDASTDGGADAAILTVTINSEKGQSGWLLRSMEGIVNFNGLRKGMVDWKEQVTGAFYCCGSPEEQKEASKLDWACHLISLPWKIIFSLVPPTSVWGGWACFYFSLVGIALLTIGISDLAELFGCVLDIRDDVTAITFVALGTSMPDLFASLSAAKEEPTADASIVNVTGSNSVNVFLGLGLPWTFGAIYWTVTGQTEDWRRRYPTHVAELGLDGGAVFVVESGNLSFCVLVFGIACAVALLILHLRRRILGAELGGPFVPKVTVFSAFVLFWLGFISVSSWRVDRWEQATMAEVVGVLGGISAFEVLVTVAAIASIVAYRNRGGDLEDGGSNRSEPSLNRSQSGQSIGSGSSKNSKRQELPKAQSSSSLSEGILGIGGGQGVGLRVLKPRFANMVTEQRI